MVESTQTQLQLRKDLGEKHTAGMEETNKHLLDIKYDNQRNIKEYEKRYTY